MSGTRMARFLSLKMTVNIMKNTADPAASSPMSATMPNKEQGDGAKKKIFVIGTIFYSFTDTF